MQISYSHKKLIRLAENAALLIGALALSYIEAILPLTAVILPPGVKLGLANLCVILAAGKNGLYDAAAVSLARVMLSAILFGSVSSLAFSFGGALCSLLILALARPLVGRVCSWIGVSVLCAAAHNVGQIAVASFWLHTGAVFVYLPILLLFAVFFGGVIGALANAVFTRLHWAGGGKA